MKWPCLLAFGAALVSAAVPAETRLIGGDMHFHGTVVALTCSLPPGGDRIVVDFGQIATKDLYLSGRSSAKKFKIQLADCNPDVFRSVAVTFSGTEDTALPDHLAIGSGSGASGIAIGISEDDGTPVHLNQSTTAQQVQKGDMALEFQAWVEAEPDAVANKSLKYGEFSASGTWTLSYQ
ncbi:fimbrial protein [uncultured Pluralibacter sp.]|uniref:fimbrial protein n=1 Tax=uncultured Pluralibacter sp. TaxID=1490864 RepID=UPI002613EEC5|nr:fimbrial protein [uncultured Pluralibacter sp.]